MNREEAAKKARQAQLDAVDGDEEELRRKRAEWGRKGGKKKVPKGFSADPKKAAQAGKLSQQMRRMKKRHTQK